MKITIEIDDKELKDLIFGVEKSEVKNEERNEKEICYFGTSRPFSHERAEYILNSMKDTARVYGFVTIADYKDLVDVKPLYTDIEHGWSYSEICHARIEHKYTDTYYGYIIRFPKTTRIS